MSEYKFLDYNGLTHLSEQIKNKLKIVNSLPTDPVDGTIVYYNGPDTEQCRSGNVYKFVANDFTEAYYCYKIRDANSYVYLKDNPAETTSVVYVSTSNPPTSLEDFSVSPMTIETISGDEIYLRDPSLTDLIVGERWFGYNVVPKGEWKNCSDFKVYYVRSTNYIWDELPKIKDAIFAITDGRRIYIGHYYNGYKQFWHLFNQDYYEEYTLDSSGKCTSTQKRYLFEDELISPYLPLVELDWYGTQESKYGLALDSENFLWGGLYARKNVLWFQAEKDSEFIDFCFDHLVDTPTVGEKVYKKYTTDDGHEISYYLDGEVTSVDSRESFVVTTYDGISYDCELWSDSLTENTLYQQQAISYTLDTMPSTEYLPVGFEFVYDGPTHEESGETFIKGKKYKIVFENNVKSWSVQPDEVLKSYSTMPTPTDGELVVYNGTDQSTYITGHIYKALILTEWRYRTRHEFTATENPLVGDPIYDYYGNVSSATVEAVGEDSITVQGVELVRSGVHSLWIDTSVKSIPTEDVEALFE